MYKNYLFLASALALSVTSLQAQIFITGKSIDKSETSAMTNPLADVTPPQLSCLSGIQTNFMPTGMIQLWASDFVASVSDNVTPVNQIQLGIRRAGSGSGFPLGVDGQPNPSLLFVCAEHGEQQVELWARDQAGNTSHCVTSLVLQDNSGACDAGAPGLIQVTSTGAIDCSVEGIDFFLSGTDSLGAPFLLHQSGDIGHFTVPFGSSGTITLSKNDNPLNGVTTYDWVLISKHIYNIEALSNPYKIIAADVNRDGMLNVQDSIDFYHLILGIDEEFPNNNPSVRFIPETYLFQNPANPLTEAFPESYSFNNIQGPLSVNFIPVKVGDVNGSFICNSTAPGDPEFRKNPASAFLQAAIFPNPTHDGATMTLHLPITGFARIQIMDVSGKLVLETGGMMPAGEQQINIPATALQQPGMYLWRVLLDRQLTSGKLIRL